MGCCVSTGNTGKTSSSAAATKPHLSYNVAGGSPPASNFSHEEDTVVKEVLSETPSLPKPTVSSRFTKKIDDEEEDVATKKGATPLLFPELHPYDVEKHHHHHRGHRVNDAVFMKHMAVFATSDEYFEDASEISASAAAEKAPYYHQDDVSKIRQISPAKYRNSQFSRESAAGKSPARRSPGRVRSTVGNSDMRSMSPGSRAGLGRCPSARGVGRSPDRVGSDTGGRIRRLDQDGGNREKNLPPPTTSNESLENPLVSLECFIFL